MKSMELETFDAVVNSSKNIPSHHENTVTKPIGQGYYIVPHEDSCAIHTSIASNTKLTHM